MIISTSIWGDLEVNEKEIYRFEKGIPGFEETTEFVLLDQDEAPFYYLQSLQQKELSFVVVDPFIFYPDYEFELPDSEAEELKIESNLVVRSILTLQEQVENSTINLLAPLVFNPDNRQAKQVVLHQSQYQTKHSLQPVKEDKTVRSKEGE
ncbi:flagellar assembly protein FliW [Paenibacillus sp. EKM202P]|uniref:flagellar assembly protein FliW n=1 Tax=Paenibacillus TaxID=44249 RepID=UPI0013EB0851|nr:MULTISPECIES: flagellar assembly protein FliW [unclassified Paenibacillus]KAF6567474.1 flagellar assembly protein FliW [Paenibacillus sp. EKM202P]KAF6573412.1 flagellar assembly protein FliW [Paenibacillus sp. EKM207P]